MDVLTGRSVALLGVPAPLAGTIDAAPGLAQWLAWSIWLLVVFAGVYPLLVAYLVWGERKAAARFQDRIGPNRVGPFGLLQSVADLVKLITKEDLVPRDADRWVHLLAPVLLLISAMLVLAVVPVGFGGITDTGALTGLVPVDLPSGLLYLIAVSSLSALGVFLAGWSSRNKFALFGAMRAVAQLVSYEVPQVLATVPVILWAGSLSLVRIMDTQVETGWFVASPPGLVAFAVFLVASIAEVNRTPFDLPEAESEIIAGFHTEYSGMRFGLFFLAEYMNVFAVSCLAALLFLGGGALPFTRFPKSLLDDSVGMTVLVNTLTVGVFALKMLLFVFLMFWIRATLPRLRVDQLMGFAWKVLVPISIANLPIAALWYELVLRSGGTPAGRPGLFDLTWLKAVLITAVLELGVLWAVRAVNRAAAASADPNATVPAARQTPALAAR